LCTASGIACISFLEKDDVFALATLNNISWLTSIYEGIEDTKHIGEACSCCREILLGGQRCTILENLMPRESYHSNNSASKYHVPQLILRGSTKGVVNLYYYAIKKALRVLQFAAQSQCSSSTNLSYLPGAFAIERKLVTTYFTSKKGDATSYAKQILHHALGATGATLTMNISSCMADTCDITPRMTLLDAQMTKLKLEDPAVLGYVLDQKYTIETPVGR